MVYTGEQWGWRIGWRCRCCAAGKARREGDCGFADKAARGMGNGALETNMADVGIVGKEQVVGWSGQIATGDPRTETNGAKIFYHTRHPILLVCACSRHTMNKAQTYLSKSRDLNTFELTLTVCLFVYSVDRNLCSEGIWHQHK